LTDWERFLKNRDKIIEVGTGFFIFGAIIFVIVFLRFIDPEKSLTLFKCPFNLLTGLYCPGCGSTRSLHHLLNGRLFTAFSFNPMLMILLPFLLFHFIRKGINSFRGRPTPLFLKNPKMAWALFGFMMLFWILRNIPLYPFTFLAP